MPYDDTASGEVLDYDADAMPTRCTHTTRMSGMVVRCECPAGHTTPHRVTATWVDGEFL